MLPYDPSISLRHIARENHNLEGYVHPNVQSSTVYNSQNMTNLDSILKSRDITLPTEVHLVKAMVLPVIMYGCESPTLSWS